MSVRTTVTLDEDVYMRLKEESVARGVPFQAMLNEAVRSGLTSLQSNQVKKRFRIKPVNLGGPLVSSLDHIGEVIEAVEGDWGC